MRRAQLVTSFLLLIAGLLWLWSVRFDQIPGASSVNLADLRHISPHLPPGAEWLGSDSHPTLRMARVPTLQRREAVRIEMPGFPAVGALQIHFSMAAHQLARGTQEWDDGRVMIEWQSTDGRERQEIDPVHSLRDNDQSGDVTVVARPSCKPAVPVLRVEHLGTGGDFDISEFEMIPVKERPIWKYGRWALLAGWFLWLVCALGGRNKRSLWRRVATAAICLGTATYFAVPGPWKTLRPLVVPFQSAPPITITTACAQPPTGTQREATTPQRHRPSEPSISRSEVLGKIPVSGGWIVQIKHHLTKLKPLLHALLLFAPALAMAFLVGRNPAIALATGLAIATEAAQTAFGYGFDAFDVFDLLCDGTGIAMAIWAYQKLRSRP